MPIKNEIVHAVHSMLEALTVFKDRRELTARIDGAADQCNDLLAGAHASFSESPLVQRIDPLRTDPYLPYQTGGAMPWVERHRGEFTVYTPS